MLSTNSANETTYSLNSINSSPLETSLNAERQHDNSNESVTNLNLRKKGMNLGFLNVQGLCSRDMTKFSEIQLMLTAENNKNLHIFGMCETKLKSHKPTNVFHINGFQTPYRKDNNSNGGGGILVYVRDHIMSKRRDDLETNDIACLWLEITPNKGKPFLCGTMYRNPSELVEWNDRFELFIEKVLTEGKEIVLFGDFNKDLFNINAHRDWANLTESFGLSQLVMQPTRITMNSSTLIDHIYSNNEDNISSVRVSELSISDHYAVFCNRKVSGSYKNKCHKTITYRSFKHFNENDFLADLMSIDWDVLETLDDVDDIVDKWYTLFINTVNKHAPLKTQRVKYKTQPDWITSEILDAMKERDNHKKHGNIEEYKALRNNIATLINLAKKSTYENKIETGKDYPKSIWKIFKEFGASSKHKNNSNNDILGLKINGETVTDNIELADSFNNYFINIASDLKEPLQQNDLSKLNDYINSKVPDNVVFDLPDIDENFVHRFLSSLDTTKATGLDGIGAKLLKLSSGVISKSITFIAKKCIQCCRFPTVWKQAKVTPLHKGGAKDELNNYRPISILPTLSKLLEKFIHKHFISYLNHFSMIHPTQSGFRSGHSTESALTLMTENWLKALNEGKIVGSIMVDFRKAFDLVDHDLLLEKTKCYKCSNDFVSLMKSYLGNRQQVVSVNNEMSDSGFIKCGVPQGSILGPLLFLIFINDLPLYLPDQVKADLYADDTTIYDAQTDLNALKSNLQNCLISLHKWCQQNGMLLNTTKTKVMLITTRQKRLHIDDNVLSLTYDNIDLQITTGDKILGINIDENLQWNMHYQAVCKKLSSYLWLLSKIQQFLSSEHKLLYYKAYIQPHLNYCNTIWGNSSNYNITKITRLQKRAFKFILGDEYIDYETAKSSLNVLSIEQNVFLNKAKMMFKVVNNLVPEYLCQLFEKRELNSFSMTLRSSSNQVFTVPKPNLVKFKESLSYSGPIIWNSIPNEITNSDNIGSFSNKLISWMTRTNPLI